MLAHKPYDDCPYQETLIPFIMSLIAEPFIEVILGSKKERLFKG
jgi:hypothetical protein